MGQIHDAAASGDIEQVKELLASGTDMDEVDGKQRTALHHAARRGHVAIVELLIERGADVNPREAISGHTPLHLAERWGHEDAAAVLVANGGYKGAALRGEG